MKIYSNIQLLFAAAAAVASVAFVLPASAASDKEQAAAAFIENLAEQTIAILNKDLTDDDLEEAMTKLLGDNVAIERIGRVVAGQYLRRMSPAQRVAYDEMYREWVIATVTSRFKGFADVGWVLKQTFSRKKDVIVRTLITDPASNETVNCDWRVREIKGRPQILDVAVAGLSMAATQKSEFGAILSRDGIDGLLAQLQIQIEKR